MRRYIKFFVLSLLAVLILWWFGRGLDWVSVRAAVARADGRLLAAAVAVICFSYLLRAWRWRALLAPLAPEVSLRELFAATTVGFGAVFLIGRTGEVVRPAFLPLNDSRVSPSASFVTIGVERIYDLVAVVLLFAGNLLWFRPPGGGTAAYDRVRMAGFIMLAGSVLGIVVLVLFRRYSGEIISRFESLTGRLPALLRRPAALIKGLMEQTGRALGVLVDLRELSVTVGWTVALWAAVTLANLLVFRAFGLGFGLSETIFVLGWALVGSLVPTPGGAAGAFHAATAAGLIFLNVDRDRAAAVSIVTHITVFAPALFIWLYYFLRSNVDLARLREFGAKASHNDLSLEDGVSLKS